MPCLNCGSAVTCEAHIIPKKGAREIIKRSTRKTLSLLAPNRVHNFMQSGFVDNEILCSRCDGVLGVYDNHATQILRLLGTEHEVIDRQANRFKITRGKGVNHEHLALFGAAVVWRTSVSKYRELAEFTLGNNEAWMRKIVFRQGNEIPTVLVARLVGRTALTHEAAMTALMYPVRIKMRGIWVARFYFGGLIFFVQTTRAADASLCADAVTTFGRSAGPACLAGVLYRFEELADLRQVRQSKHVQQVLARRDGAFNI